MGFKKMSDKKQVIIAAGGTGGHFFPSIVTGELLINRGYNVHLITDSRCQKYLSSDSKFIVHIIDSKINNDNFLTKYLSIIKISNAILKSLFLLLKIKPNIIVGFGSYVTFPPLLIALILNVPIVIHEQNCFMGKVNRFFAKFAKKIAISYEETLNFNMGNKDKIVVTGSIIRENIKNIKIKDSFNNNPFRIFVFGGSQGAKIFASLIPQAIEIVIKSIPNIDLYITQQATKDQQIEIAKIYEDLGVQYKLSEFFHDMENQYEGQDLVISRAGASTTSELAYIGLPAIFIPYPFAAANHQFYNAKALEDGLASWCFVQNTLTDNILANKIIELINNPALLKQASSNLLKRRSDGNKVLADIVEKIIKQIHT